ncbi:hypothetical protein [Ruegeria sp. HKCCD8929]|uniref:hypothetical protein n=1 Tax=Ruegeria sp. HKCCD8929 TaxID=2683006 RepID=UPI001C2C3FA6|nr:hypothetical protein [Ruegeria sp. HKCCD8929]
MVDLRGWELCQCPIWGTPAHRNPSVLGDVDEIYSPRAGGKFQISGSAASTDKHRKQASLSRTIFEFNYRGETPNITSAEIARAHIDENVPVPEKYDRFIACIAHLFPKLGKDCATSSLWKGESSWIIQAALGSQKAIDGGEREEISLLINEANQQGHIQLFQPKEQVFRLSYTGHLYASELGVTLSKSDKIFVAMWFGSHEQTTLYHDAIAPAIQNAGYLPVRIDNTEHNEKIDDQIIAEIRKSKAVIVDLTCGLAKPEGWSTSELVGSPRGGVFYEAGFAKGLGLPVIWTVKADIADVENVVHFDIRQFNQIRWNADLNEFREKLLYRIEATLGRGNYESKVG